MGNTEANGDALDLIGATAHELKTPLTLIYGISATLETESCGQLSDTQKQQVRQIRQASQRLDNLIQSLLHVEGLPYMRRLRPVQLRYELQAVVDECAPAAASRAIELSVATRTTPPALAEPGSVYYAISHALHLVLKSVPDKSTVNLKLRRSGDQVVLDIDYPGEPLRPSEARKDGKGPGVHQQLVRSHGGVSWFIIQSIVEFFQGELTATATKHGGRITIRLPVSNQLSLFT